MKTVFTSLFLGSILLYFLDSALNVENFSLEMMAHNLVRFFSGFLFLGIWVWYEHKLKFKISLYIILVFLISDDILDYFRDIDNLIFEMVIHDAFVVVWGAATGFFLVRYLHKKKNSVEKI